MIWRFVPGAVVRWARRVVLHYPAPMRMTAVPEQRVRTAVAAAGGEVVDAEPVDEPETHWAARRYVVRAGG